MTTNVLQEKNAFLSSLQGLRSESAPAGLQRLRKEAWNRFGELGLPGPRNEDWKFTNLAPLAKTAFKPAGYAPGSLTLKKIKQAAFTVAEGSRLVFVNGIYAPDLSTLAKVPDGVIISNLKEAVEKHADLVSRHLAQHAKHDEHPFTSLNTALFQDGGFIYVPKGRVVEEPIQLIFLSQASGEPSMSYPRNLVIGESQSQVTVVESYVGLDDDVYFTNAITEVLAEDSANVDHYKIQQESESAFHIATIYLHQKRTSRFSSHYVGLGGGLVRHEARALLAAEGCECTLNGLYIASGRQHADNHTVIDHAMPNCASHELYKGILDGKAHGVFNGKIFVRQDAQKTDAKQTNQTLLLSEDAVINTKPQLEIFADDVKCTHGATVGQLDAESIFYLRTRGIGEKDARNLLTFAFANDVIGRIKIESLRSQLEDFLLETQHLGERS